MINHDDIKLNLSNKYRVRDPEKLIGFDFNKLLAINAGTKYKWWEHMNRSAWIYKYYLINPYETKIRSYSKNYEKIKYSNIFKISSSYKIFFYN